MAYLFYRPCVPNEALGTVRYTRVYSGLHCGPEGFSVGIWYTFTLASLGCQALLAGALSPPATVVDHGQYPASTQPMEVRKEAPSEATSAEGLIRLDATVRDDAGRVVSGLQRADFEVLDNGRPQQIIAFRKSEGSTRIDDSLTVILLIDSLALPSQTADFERQEAAGFLKQNSGHLTQPVTIYALEDSGFFLVANASTDGNAMAQDVIADNKIDAFFVAPNQILPFKSPIVDASFYQFPSLAGARALGTIATREDRKPGRKLLLWIGPGFGDRGTGAYAPTDGVPRWSRPSESHADAQVRRDLFQKILWFSVLLRQSRVSVICLSVAENVLAVPLGSTDDWRQFLSGVLSDQQAQRMNLDKRVLAVQSGGAVVPPSKDLIRQMNDCIRNAATYYTLTFNPPLASHPDEYHSLKVEVARPGAIVHTSTGYYDQPFFDDPPYPGAQQVTVAQLEQILRARHGPSEVHELTGLTLTERLSRQRLQSILREFHRKTLAEDLERLADEAAFRAPPPSLIAADPPPDPALQQRILAAASSYLSQVIPKLPDFFATRSEVSYQEDVSYRELDSTIAPVPLHVQERSTGTVLYLHGAEVIETGKQKDASAGGRSLLTNGTFGPFLRTLADVLRVPGGLSWSRWENDSSKRSAVFRFGIFGVPSVSMAGCCFPDGGEKSRVAISATAHGEIAIDPATGAILRAQVENDLSGFVPTEQEKIMVRYGPVNIAGNTYILPIRSVNFWRARAVATFFEWNLSFPTWGPYETKMNVFTFGHYHMFHGSTRMLPGFSPVPESSSTAAPTRPE